ncbi:ejaculatory bulb-specific protein 3-like [Prorops nasuta]|uniref:ejaculatory bulb-specific protein 3-like n=1 Tax=Prorops nasuta TaxID=863751 RepID=UPI0034CFEE38
MQVKIFVALLVIGLAGFCQSQDVSGLLMDQRLVSKEIRCVLQQGHCDAIGRQIRGLLPEVLNNDCRRCTQRQARNARKLVEFMQRQHPIEWNQIVEMYTNPRRYY